MRTNLKKTILPVAALLLAATASKGQVSVFDVDRHGSLYLGIGTHSPSYKASTIRIKQSGSGNDYDLVNVAGDDQTNKSSSILNSSFRLGYFFNNNQDLAIELSYDPFSYHVTDGQTATVSGMVAHAADVNKTITFSAANGYYYYLNGSNHVLVNLVKRFGLYKTKMHTLYVDALVKAGVGPVMPSISNSIEGKVTENPSFQVSGWNVGFEPALRLTIYKYLYLEGAWKYGYASYSNLNVYDGTASQKLTTTAFIFSIGGTISTTKRNPRFDKVQKQRPIMTIGTMNNGNID